MPDEIKRYKVVTINNAWEQLYSHADFLSNVSQRAADAMVETYVKQSDALAMFPERYPWLDIDGVPPKKYRKMMFSGNYLALYVVDNENMRVYVDAVVDCRADYGFLL